MRQPIEIFGVTEWHKRRISAERKIEERNKIKSCERLSRKGMSILHSCYGGRLHADVTPSSLAEKVQREIAPLIVILTTKKKDTNWTRCSEKRLFLIRKFMKNYSYGSTEKRTLRGIVDRNAWQPFGVPKSMFHLDSFVQCLSVHTQRAHWQEPIFQGP